MAVKYKRRGAPAAPRVPAPRPGLLGLRHRSQRQWLVLIYVMMLIFVLLLLFAKHSLDQRTATPAATREGLATIAEKPASSGGQACSLALDLALASGKVARVEAQLPCPAWERLQEGDRVMVLYRFDKASGAPVISEVGLVALPESGQL